MAGLLAEGQAVSGYDVKVPTLDETRAGFIGPLNPYIGHIERIVRIRRHKRGPRVYVAGRIRIHHGPAFGLAAAVAWRARFRILAAALAGIAATDWRDFPFRDRDNH